MKYITALFFLALAMHVDGQCNFKKLLDEGILFAGNGNYEMALNKFNSARRCDPKKGEIIDLEVEKVFLAITKQRDDARKQRGIAEMEKQKAVEAEKAAAAEKEKALQLAQILTDAQSELASALTRTETALFEVRTQQEKNERIIDAFYFYAGRFALAVKKDIEGDKYGFIDPQGNEVIEYKYQQALPFDYTGYARVKRAGKDYLIDTLGAEFPLVFDIKDLTRSTLALDLRNKSLFGWPKEIFENRQIKILLASGNNLADVPRNIQKMTELEYLDLSRNYLQFHFYVGDLPALKRLDLSHNLIYDLGQVPFGNPALTSLNLSHNQIKTLSLSSARLPDLQELDVSYNQIHSIYPALDELSRLRSLNLQNNRLDSLPATLGNMAQLQYLNLADNSLGSIPESFSKLTRLKELYLGYNALSALSFDLTAMAGLQILDLQFNQINILPASLSKLSGLKALILDGNLINSLPDEIFALSNLGTLSARLNNLGELPPGFINLGNLKKLNLSRNNLAVLPPSLEKLHSLQYADFSYNRLTSVPPSIWKMGSLQSLDISANNISDIATDSVIQSKLTCLNVRCNLLSKAGFLSQLPGLIILDLGNNLFKEIPGEIIGLKNLKNLVLSNNHFYDLSLELPKASKVKNLDISGNLIAELPVTISGQIEKLELRYNLLQEFPGQVAALKNLHDIDLTYNNIAAFPDAGQTLGGLERVNFSYNRIGAFSKKSSDVFAGVAFLDVSFNEIKKLPADLKRLTNLRELNLRGNRLFVTRRGSTEYSPYITKRDMKKINNAKQDISDALPKCKITW